jgi:methionyl-tRNA synthetase
VNADLVGKFVNIASRCAGFVTNQFDGRLCALNDEYSALYQSLRGTGHGTRYLKKCAVYFAERNFSKVLSEVSAAADAVNELIAARAPWKLAKDASRTEELHQICSFALSAYRLMCAWLKPIVPQLVAASEAFLNATIAHVDDVDAPLPAGHRINAFTSLATRVDPKAIEAMIAASTETLAPTPTVTKPAPAAPAETGTIGIESFAAVDLRIARIVAAEAIAEADKLLKLTLDVGPLGQRQVFAGIKSAYAAESLVGRLTVIVANLAPRKMRFGVSEGMVLAASDANGGPFLLAPDAGAEAGMRVK